MYRTSFQRRARIAATAVLLPVLACLSGASHASVGAKIILQDWEPANHNLQRAIVPIDDPQLISAPLIQAWNQARAPLCEALKSAIGQPDLVHAGVSLYNISCQLNALDVRLEPVSQNRARFVVELDGSRLAATSTTPTLAQIGADLPLIGGTGLTGGADPRFSVTVNARFVMDVEIGDAPSPFLTVRQARFEVMNASARGENITGKLAEWVVGKVVPFFGGPNFKQMAEGRINGLGASVLGPVQQALAPVNARVAKYSNYVRVSTWISPTRIAVAFQPRNLPKPPLDGEMRGTLTDGRVVVAGTRNNLCPGFAVSAQYQDEPRRLLSPDDLSDLAPAHLVTVGSLQAQQNAADGSCVFSLRGLARGVTNEIHATHALEKRGGGSLARLDTVLRPKGWDGLSVVPNPIQTERNYVLTMDPQGSAAVVQLDPRRHRIDPITSVTSRIGPASATNPARIAVMSTIDKQGLNPQPVPPKVAATVLPPAVATLRLGTTTGVAATKALNPQPLPPKLPAAIPAAGSMQALNPQPVPPTANLSSTALLHSSGASVLRMGPLPISTSAGYALH